MIIPLSREEESELKSQFDVNDVPSIRLYKEGQMYSYRHEKTLAAFTKYVDAGYTSAYHQRIPGRKGFLAKALDYIFDTLEGYVQVMDNYGMYFAPRGVKMAIILIIFMLPFVLVPFCIYMVIVQPPKEEEDPHKVKKE